MIRFLGAFLAAVAAFAQPADLDAWVARTMKVFDVPGIAVAIVKDGRPVLLKGYGVRDVGKAENVDEHTLFGIASNTKAFTAAAAAILVDEGKLQWNDPVQKHLPAFSLYDPYVTRELTIRDLLCHRIGLGLGAGDLLFWPDTTASRDDVLAAARYIRPASSFRSKYAYNNLAFVVAGEAVRAASGQPWDSFVRERIFAPAGMAETMIASEWARTGVNRALPHSRGWRLTGTLTSIPATRDETWAAAAGIRSNAADLAKWLVLQLNRGVTSSGKRVWSEAASKEMWSAQTVVPIGEPSETLKSIKPAFSAYGLGWAMRDYKGRKIVSHGGALTGMFSTTVMVPEERLGMVVLTNQEESGALSAITYHVLDDYFRLAQTDWIAAYESERKRMLAKAGESDKKLSRERAIGTKPSLPLPKYVGECEDAWYGKMAIAEENGKLVLRMRRAPSMVADLEHWHYDTFVAVWREKTIPDAFVTFTLSPRGTLDAVRMEPTSPLADFSFDYQDLLFRPVVAEKSRKQ